MFDGLESVVMTYVVIILLVGIGIGAGVVLIWG